VCRPAPEPPCGESARATRSDHRGHCAEISHQREVASAGVRPLRHGAAKRDSEQQACPKRDERLAARRLGRAHHRARLPGRYPLLPRGTGSRRCRVLTRPGSRILELGKQTVHYSRHRIGLGARCGLRHELDCQGWDTCTWRHLSYRLRAIRRKRAWGEQLSPALQTLVGAPRSPETIAQRCLVATRGTAISCRKSCAGIPSPWSNRAEPCRRALLPGLLRRAHPTVMVPVIVHPPTRPTLFR
jgi:hypothetical protein